MPSSKMAGPYLPPLQGPGTPCRRTAHEIFADHQHVTKAFDKTVGKILADAVIERPQNLRQYFIDRLMEDNISKPNVGIDKASIVINEENAQLKAENEKLRKILQEKDVQLMQMTQGSNTHPNTRQIETRVNCNNTISNGKSSSKGKIKEKKTLTPAPELLARAMTLLNQSYLHKLPVACFSAVVGVGVSSASTGAPVPVGPRKSAWFRRARLLLDETHLAWLHKVVSL